MATYSSTSTGALKLECPADVFFHRFTRKEQRRSLFFSDEDLKFNLESKDEPTRTMSLKLTGNVISQDHGSVNVTFTVNPGEQIGRSSLDFFFKFEKIRNTIQNSMIIEPVLCHIQAKAFAYHGVFRSRSFYVGKPANTCFMKFEELLRNSDVARPVGVDFRKRILKMEFTGPLFHKDFYNVRATVTITPKKGETNDCCVKWHIDSVNKLSGSFSGVADLVYKAIANMLKAINWEA